MLKKPKMLKAGDKVATISLSWGGAGEPDLRWRYEQGIDRLRNVFGLEVVAMPNSLKGGDYLYENPQARAEDLMNAFKDPTIKGIFSNIGGSESIRLLPYIDFDVIRDNPKVFIGYSDSTVTHLFCHKAGISSFYGPAILTDFAENVEMHEYTVEALKKALFTASAIGEVKPATEWTSERLEWIIENKDKKRKMNTNKGYELLQGAGIAQGRLIGGCIEVLEFAKGTSLWPAKEYWKDSILFFETSEELPTPGNVEYWLRNYGTQGILQQAKGIIFGKPQNEKYYEEYKESIRVIMKELSLENLPVLYNLNFGHTEPKFVLPYGAMAEINCENRTFSILDSGVE
ncbi:Muramoyltetrapeptide carboxypeptidase LdcA (peptidoglycan recycling) [Psychrobacillus psychrotolerans]|uniref:Muramoyltetrapeptide carboxypeptidase LdcA (Peptidoglycan recycling) n=1 Tax=Psychrobacillus psychrotolerans TaxID=126156 RepID=A0A1I6AMM3_9BACI|nr:S66 peptidase family protein [Psychrobacillus psychrotolerans]SFQ69945.1 Muramoyltetrapeptide carboxypeptidase LdcA (peptidoglycan recycling) [Psychrobacillus psychrotolerans]